MVTSTPREVRKCRHCSLPFAPRRDHDAFCCSGCRVVYELIEGEGFSDFYRLLGDKALVPLNDQPTLPAELAWLEEADWRREPEISVRVANLTCTACVWLIERLFRRMPGAVRIGIDTSRSTIHLHRDPDTFDTAAFFRELHRFGYPVSPLDESEEDEAGFQESRNLMTRLGVTFGLALNTMAFTLPSYLGLEFADDLAGLFRLVAFASSSLALAVGGSYFIKRGWASLRTGLLHMDVPISLGLVIAYAGSLAGYASGTERLMYFDFVATFVTLMLLGRYLHLRVIEHNRNQLKARERNVISVRRRSGTDEPSSPISLRSIAVGDILEIGPGSLVPVRGNLHSGDPTRISLDWINGEPAPITVRRGAELPAGARNVSPRTLEMKVVETFEGSLMEALLGNRPGPTPTDPRTSRILQWYLIIVIALALAGAIWWWFATRDPVMALQVWISILVVSCPCALGLALPLIDEIANSKMRNFGVFVRNNTLWQRLPRVRSLVFDKTGTLTEPVPRLKNAESLEALDPDARRALFLLVETNSHPHGAALREAWISAFGSIREEERGACEVEENISRGMTCRLGGEEWRLGKAEWALRRPNGRSGTVLSREGECVAEFEIGETIRQAAKEEIAILRASGLAIEILSGDPDRERVVDTGRCLGIDPQHIHSGQSPEAKANHLKERRMEEILFVGDGGNDGMALELAGCSGVSATGIQAVESKADFVFLGRDFRAVRRIWSAARKRRRVVTLVFSVAVAYNVAAIGLCLAGMMSPLLAAVLMPLSSLVTTAIATRA